MKVTLIGQPQVIMSNPGSKHNYFAWPTVARLQNGKIAVAASGFRLRHICPFGKTVLAYSEDEGQTYTAPAPVIDTVLDDRDGGIVPFGKSGVIVTSFNNTVAFQRDYAADAYSSAYLDTLTEAEEKAALGVGFRFSQDCGVTFGPLYKSPVSSPHGPLELPDGQLLWIGRPAEENRLRRDTIQAYRIRLDGSAEYVGEIPEIRHNGQLLLSCEPHAIVLKDGTILAQIRVQTGEGENLFTVYQSESRDGGRTWAEPRQILSRLGGSPPHLLMHSSGTLVSAYGHRAEPFGIRAMFSRDNGETWDVDYDIYLSRTSRIDIGYPSTVELKDGSLLTVFYAQPAIEQPAVVMQQRWRMEE